jgi:hypothetical protein
LDEVVDFFFLAVDLLVEADLALAVPLPLADLAVALPLAVDLPRTVVVVQRWPRRQCVRVAVAGAAGLANGWPLASSSSYASIMPSS